MGSSSCKSCPFDSLLVLPLQMAVPYGDPNNVFQRKCAFDVGDYGLGFCTNSLELGCDCLGHIKYFDAVLNNSKGESGSQHACPHTVPSGLPILSFPTKA